MSLEIQAKWPAGPTRTVDLQRVLGGGSDSIGRPFARVWIFGSRRHVTRSVRSDIDLLVDVGNRPLTLREASQLRIVEPYVDWFCLTDGRATSVANESQINAADEAALLDLLDAEAVLEGDEWIETSDFRWHLVLSDHVPPMTSAVLNQFADPLGPTADGVVVAALREEYEALTDVFAPEVIHGAHLSTARVLAGHMNEALVRLMCVDRMGSVEAAAATTDQLRETGARWVILCGIAGGLSGKVDLGDIVVPQALFDYEYGKVSTARSTRWGRRRGVDVESSPAFYNADRELHSIASELARNFRLSADAQILRPDKSEPSVKTESVLASGAKVVADARRAREVASLHRKCSAIEMEASGVAAAARRADLPRGFLVVKGISDLADKDKGDDWHAAASRASAEFAMAVVRGSLA